MHRILTAHMIGKGRYLQFDFNATHDIQIRHAGFYHDHVGAFLKVQRHLMDGLITVSGVHLVGLLVAPFHVGC